MLTYMTSSAVRARYRAQRSTTVPAVRATATAIRLIVSSVLFGGLDTGHVLIND
jgi:hypothetical protein